MKKSTFLLLSLAVLLSATSLMAQDNTQLALDIGSAREKSSEQLMTYSWQRSVNVLLNEEEKIHTEVKIWFDDEGKMEGSTEGGIESMGQIIGADLADLFEQTTELVVNYVFLSQENWIELMDRAKVKVEDDVVNIVVSDLLVQDDKIHIIIDGNTNLFSSIEFSSFVEDYPVKGLLEFETKLDGTNYPSNTEIIIPEKSMKITSEIIGDKNPETMKNMKTNNKDENKGSLTKALGPLIGNALISGQLFKAEAELTEADPDILAEYDIKIPISEGYNLTANIYRSKTAAANGEKVPVVMCAHPYNNNLTPALKNTPFNGPPQQYRMIPQAGKPVFSELTSWEAPDPNFWVPEGYAIVNMNLPGYATSEGPPTAFSESQGKAYYEAIEWVAKQPWCDGNVGLNGVSFLAISQYHVAACQEYGGPPPSLKAISPWEGLTDVYRDIFCYGGVSEVGFPLFWWATEVKPAINGTEEDYVKAEGSIPTDYIKNHPFYDDFWKAKAAKLEEITVPMLVCASFSDHGLHTKGSFRAFEKASSEHKWVYTHRWGKWDAYYSQSVQEMTKDFMDCFLKGDTTSGFLQTPPVRLEVRSSLKEIHEVRYENEWPIARTQYTKLLMGESKQSLSLENPKEPMEVVYSAKNGKAIFNFKFNKDTELSGYMKVRVWVEARPKKKGDPSPEDMVMFAAVNKLNQKGKSVNFYGTVGLTTDMITRGWLKVSRRELDTDESTEWQPIQKGTSELLLKPGEVVPVDIELYPSSTFFSAGESIQLILASDEIIKSPPYRKSTVINSGNHVLHFGGKYDSYLLIPVIPPKEK